MAENLKNLTEGIDQISERFIDYLRNELDNTMIDYDEPLTQLQGGFETSIYRFKLKGVPKDFSKPLILRLYPRFYGIRNAIWESAIQNAIAGEGYPVPRAYLTCTDMSILGGAFFIMDFLLGEPLITVPLEVVPVILGKTHAALHNVDPRPLIRSLSEQGISKNAYNLSSRLKRLKKRARKLRWIRGVIKWLKKNRPPEPEALSVCHGDFHPLNILMQNGKVTGVLDWGSFLIADPALDIACTIMLITVNSKHLFPALKLPFHSLDWEMLAEQYLDAYRSQRLLDSTHIDYYKVMRSANALLQGFEGQKILQHPLIVKDLIECIHKITGIQITIPD